MSDIAFVKLAVYFASYKYKAAHLHDDRDDPRCRVRYKQNIQCTVPGENQKDPDDSGSDRSDNRQNHRHGRMTHAAQRPRKQIHYAAQKIRKRRIGQNLHSAADDIRIAVVDF